MKRKGWGIITPEGKLTWVFKDKRNSAIRKAGLTFGRWPMLYREGWRAVRVVMEDVEE